MSDKIKEVVKQTYTNVVSQPGTGCCAPSSCCGTTEQGFLNESYAHVAGYEAEADYGLGCGIPTDHAKIKAGDTVLDLGSGAGNDAFIARSRVGEQGKVIGVDMTEAMVAKANENKAKLGYNNVEFVLGEIENLPVADASINVAISNCVLNLVPDKLKAYQEVYRVLQPGGHFSMSDIVLNGALPEGVQQAAEMYAGCVSGAMEQAAYLAAIKKAGFKNLHVFKEQKVPIPDAILLRYASPQELEDYKKSGHGIVSLGVYAEK